MATDSTDHQVGTWSRKIHGFNPLLGWSGDSSRGYSQRDEVRRNPSRTQSPVYSAIWVVDQKVKRRGRRKSRIDITGLSPISVNETLVKPGNDEVHRSTRLDFDLVGYQLVDVTVPWISHLPSVQRRSCGPLS